LRDSEFGRVITLRPDFELLRVILDRPDLSPADIVQVKRICSELPSTRPSTARSNG
jgi:hypothetical protein